MARFTSRRTLLAALLVVPLFACEGMGDGAEVLQPVEPASKIAPELLALLEAGGTVDVVVALDEAQIAADAPEGNALVLAAGDVGAELRAARFGTVKQGLVAALASGGQASPELRHDYSHLPALHFGVTSEAQLLALAARPEVLALHPNSVYQHTLIESLPLIHQPQAFAGGADGAGTTVAVLDTGTDYTRAAFGNCTAPGVPASCRVVYAADFAADDHSLDDNGHGTNVSGIVLGVAPKAQVAALDVFAGSGAYAADIIAAINWVVANRARYNIVAMNLSLGGGASTTACGSDVFAASIAAARAAGVAPVIASGNNGYTNQLSSPACAPAAISVGAVYDAPMLGLSYSSCRDSSIVADMITCFSNSASFLTLLAPGALITAAGYTMAGTSQATPHVAGAFAALRSKFPKETVDQILARLTSTGSKIKDGRNGVVTPRIDLAAAAGVAAGGAADTTPPTGSVSINGGAAAVASTAVTLTLTATDPSGVSSMCVSNSAACSAWVPFAASLKWTLAGTGKQTVSVWFKDGAGNATGTAAPVTTAVLVDQTAPVDGKVTAAAGVGQVTLSWSGFTDAASGVASYKVYGAPTTAPANCASGTRIYEGAAFTAVASGLTNGTVYAVRVCAVDLAGNVSAGVVASAKPLGDFSAPTSGAVVINDKAAATRSASVTLKLSAVDPAGVATVCVSNTSTCAASAWQPFKATLPWTLATGDGAKTVSVWFADVWGNATTAAATGAIKLDTVAPVDGKLSSTSVADGKITLAWTAATDAGSGVASYKIVAAAGAAPATCSAGTQVYAGAALTGAATGLTNGTTYGLRVCAIDAAGNTSAGLTTTARPLPETAAPTGGSVKINGGAAATATGAVTLTLAATDASGVTTVCVSNTAACTAWVPFKGSLPWTLAATDGVKTVSVWFADAWGNATTAAVSATIKLDATAPTGGAVTGAATSGAIGLSWSGFTDALSGVASYKVVAAQGTAAPAAGCGAANAVTAVYAGAAISAVHSGVTAGQKYSYRVCAVDAAGNVSAGATVAVTAK